MLYRMGTAEQVKERLNIVDVISQYVKLTKAGKNYKGLSPFKKEKTPSFYVSPDKNMYYDFSTNQGGDVFTFIEQMEGLDFRGALTLLAERAGVELRPEPKGARDAREREYAVLEEATQFYETKLGEQKGAIDYLEARGVTRATMRAFRLGFAPEGWTSVYDLLTKKGYTRTELERVGLVKRGDRGTYYDRFRSRIMFPIFDTAGRVIAFSGRIFGPAAEDKENAKYLNSPETSLFEKGRVLYGYHKAKHAIRSNNFAILVEGQMDLVLCHQAGYTNAVAVSGTGLTEAHLTLLERLSTNLLLALDADTAGKASMERVAQLALPRGMDVKVARIAVGKDPADCIKEDVEAWRSAVREATHVVPFFLEELEAKHAKNDRRTFELRARDTVLPLIARVKSPVDRAHFVRTFSDHLSLPEEAVNEELRSLVRRIAQEESTGRVPADDSRPHAVRPEMSHREKLEQLIAGLVFYAEDHAQGAVTEKEVTALSVEFGVSLSGFLARYAETRDILALTNSFLYPEGTDLYELLRENMRRYAILHLEEESVRLRRELKAAERTSESSTTDELFTRFKMLAESIAELKRGR